MKLEPVCCVGGKAATVDRADELFVRRVNLAVVQQAVQLLRRVTANLEFKEFFLLLLVCPIWLPLFFFFQCNS